MAKSIDRPLFGPLQNLKVAHSSSSVAGPFCAALMADLGADVIWIENPYGPDITRAGYGYTIQGDRRNQRTISLDISKGEGKEVFFRMLGELDIFIEASKPGQYERWGLSDEVLWEANPKLAIVHISGFGQSGDPDYVPRASYDPIAQAFAGMMYCNSASGQKATPANFLVADYYSGYMAAFSALAAVIRAGETGKGESIDVAQFEAVMRSAGTANNISWNEGVVFDRDNNRDMSNGAAAYGSYRCKDDIEIYTLVLGAGVVKAACLLFDLPYGSEDFPAKSPKFFHGTKAGDLLEAAMAKYCLAHTADEVERTFNAAGIPCSQINDYTKLLEHPHILARQSLITYETPQGREFTGYNVFPRLVNNPGKVWRGGPSIGMDNEDILEELGFDKAMIERLYESGLLTKA
ncbi:MAG TPA: crotonobetainyl-CoA--carnitine CoA-transferase [Coriobacteriia bacterium]|nr:crotonobetainyl-CoA--carnitine CoA-transferase [Coriobacteriia bacterium]